MTKGMKLTDQINIRIERGLKIDVESVLQKLGLTTSDAIRVFLAQISLTKSLPINISVPNPTTIKSITELENGEGISTDLNGLKKLIAKL